MSFQSRETSTTFAPMLRRTERNSQVASTNLEEWGTPTYPDFVAMGSGDQKAIMGAICAVKKASFDGVDCIGGDESATGTVSAFISSISPAPVFR